MKVLFIGHTERTALALHYFTNMARLGMSVLPYDPDKFRAYSPMDRLWTRIKKQPTKRRYTEIADELLTLCRRNGFDVLFVMAENFIPHEALMEIKRSSKRPPVLLYHSHDNNFADGILKPPHFFETLKEYDIVFTTKSQNVSRYKELGVTNAHYLPSAYEPSIHHPISSDYSRYANEWFGVTFIGTYDHSRRKFLEAVGWHNLYVWGDRWSKYPLYGHYKSHIQPKAIYEFEFADVTSHSKIALGLLREEAQDLHTTRTFEIPACGALQMAPRNDEVATFFKDGEEIVLFDTPEELRAKVDYYLRHETERLRIALRGYERCLSGKHTYQDRITQMFGMLHKSIEVPLPRKASEHIPQLSV